MNATTNTKATSKALAIGTPVVYTQEAREMYELPESIAKQIYEVTDSRGANGETKYTICPLTSEGPDFRYPTPVFACDIRDFSRGA